MNTLMRRNRTFFPELPSVFDDFLSRDLFKLTNEGNNGNSFPSVNVRETDSSFELEVAAPGMRKEDFNVELENNLLTISAQREEKEEEKDKEGNYTRMEFNYRSFSRSFSLPERMVNPEKVSANYLDGILHITLPKTEEAKVKPAKKIEIS